MSKLPREIDPAKTFDALVSWVHDELIVKKGAPGFVVGLSGTDSILAFLVCAKAAEKAKASGREVSVAGVHFAAPPEPTTAPEQSDDDTPLWTYRHATPEALEAFLKDMPPELQALGAKKVLNEDTGAGQDNWFQQAVIPWLKERAPNASVIVDTSINHRMDGQRWGALLDWSVVADPATGQMRPRDQSYWVVGTRNATEEALMSYSNVSMAASVQPINALYKSEILKVCDYLNVPDTAMAKSCQVDCACGRFELPALNIKYIDALLMARKGELSSQYIEENISASLRKQLDAFIDSQIKAASFKKQIPYLADGKTVQIATDVNQESLAEAKQAAKTGDDSKALSSAVPLIIAAKNANAACDLVVTESKNRDSWLPEALMLLGTAGLEPNQRKRMVEKVFSCAKCSARMGSYSFSFPRWRFISQKSGDAPALVEQFGMQRLNRDTDIRDASLSPADPNRDELGAGFTWSDDKWHVEYRRAYIVCSNHSSDSPATVVIRNNSYYFGRDRLPSPVYVSFEALKPDELNALTADTLEKSGKFIKWQNVIHAIDNLPAKDKVKRMERVLNYLDDFDGNLHRWLCSRGPAEHKGGAGPDHSGSGDEGGFKHLLSFLKAKAAQPAIKGRPGLYVSTIAEHAAPWSPNSAVALTPQLVGQLEQSSPEALAADPAMRVFASGGEAGSQLALLTGEHGDLPVLADKGTQIQNERLRAGERRR